MRLASIHTYPVKGCYRQNHERAEVEPWGLRGDRRWLIVQPDGRMLTQRDDARLATLRPSYVDGALLVRTPGMPDLVVPPPVDGDKLDVTVWSSVITATLAGPTAAEWLSRFLARPAELAWLPDTEPVSFADAYPLLGASTASLDALNGWLLESGSPEGPLPMTRFRPNVVVSGAGAWDEDGWLGRRIRIGTVEFRAPKMCDRCVVTTTDQETGERGHEPLRALARFRRIDKGLLFGMNLIPDGTGEIAVGDPVVLVED